MGSVRGHQTLRGMVWTGVWSLALGWSEFYIFQILRSKFSKKSIDFNFC
jgi:hypothetical protein